MDGLGDPLGLILSQHFQDVQRALEPPSIPKPPKNLYQFFLPPQTMHLCPNTDLS